MKVHDIIEFVEGKIEALVVEFKSEFEGYEDEIRDEAAEAKSLIEDNKITTPEAAATPLETPESGSVVANGEASVVPNEAFVVAKEAVPAA